MRAVAQVGNQAAAHNIIIRVDFMQHFLSRVYWSLRLALTVFSVVFSDWFILCCLAVTAGSQLAMSRL